MLHVVRLVVFVVLVAGKASAAAEVATGTAITATTKRAPPLNANSARHPSGAPELEPAKPKLMVVFASRASEESKMEPPRTMLLFDDMQVHRKSDVPDEPSTELLPPLEEGETESEGRAYSRPLTGYNYPKPQQDDLKPSAGYHYPKPSQDDPKPTAGYNYPKPQQDDSKPSAGYHYLKPSQDDPKPSSGYNYPPKPQEDDLNTSSGYHYPKPPQDDPKPTAGYNYPKPQEDNLYHSAGYHYPKPQQDNPETSTGYNYPKPQQDDHTLSTGYPYIKPQQDASNAGTGYDYPSPQQDPQRPAQGYNYIPQLPSSGYLHPVVQGTSTWRPLTQPPDQDYLPPKGQLPLEDPLRPAYGAPVWSGGLPTNDDEITPSVVTSPPTEYLEPKPVQQPTLQDELPFSHGQVTWPPADGYVPPKPQYESSSYKPEKQPFRDEVPTNSYLPPHKPLHDDALSNTYLPPKQPLRDEAPGNSYLPSQPLRDDAPTSYLPPKKPILEDPPTSGYLPPKQPLNDAPTSNYLPPKQPLRDDIPISNYLPPKQPLDDPTPSGYLPPKQPPRDDTPASNYLPPKRPLIDDPPTHGYLPPKKPLRDHEPSDIYDPLRPAAQPFDKEDDVFKAVQAQPRHLSASLRAGSVDEHGIRVTDMSCLRTAHRARFTATITSPRFVAWPPVLEAVPGGGAAPTDCRIIADPADPHHRFLVDLSNPDLTRCGVKGCSGDGEPRLCSRVLMPSLPGLRLASDPVLLLQCSLQPASVSLLQQARIVAAQPASGRSAGVVHAGGERAALHAHLQLYRRGAAGDFSRPMQPGGAVHLGDELQLRATVRRGDGWQSSRLSDVVVRRGSDAVHLVGADGCSNQEMRAVCPRDQGWLSGEPLVSLLTMRVFMFRGMQDGDQLVLTAKVVACLDRSDCKLSVESCEAATRLSRSKRSSSGGGLNSTTISLEDSVSFVVHHGSAEDSSQLTEKGPVSESSHNQTVFTAAVLLLAATVLPSTALLLYWCKRSRRAIITLNGS